MRVRCDAITQCSGLSSYFLTGYPNHTSREKRRKAAGIYQETRKTVGKKQNKLLISASAKYCLIYN